MSELRYPNESREYRDARGRLAQRRARAGRQGESPWRRNAARFLPAGELKEDYVFQWANDGKVGKKREVLRAVRRQEHPAALLVHVRSELGQSLSFLHVADGWVRPDLVSGQSQMPRSPPSPRRRPSESTRGPRQRGWSQIPLVSGSQSSYQADYKCQGETDDMQLPVMHVFKKQGGKIFHFWGTETMMNHVDTVWPYWNLMDFTPEGRPAVDTPPQKFRSENSWRRTI